MFLMQHKEGDKVCVRDILPGKQNGERPLQAAAQNWIATQKWPPSIAELREAALVLTQGAAPDWGEAWKKVQKLISQYGYYRPKEAYAEMDELTRKTVDGIGGFQMLCTNNIDNMVADRSKFEKLYEITARRQKEDKMLPSWLSQISEGYRINAEMGASSRDRQIEQKD